MIVFGTDGWRGVIARDYTFDNLARVALAVAEYVRKRASSPSVAIGYDTRFLSRAFAQETARILAARGVTVWLSDRVATTPQVSLATKMRKADVGIVITASHNPPEYNGFKLKGNYGGPATVEIVAAVERQLRRIESKPLRLPRLRSLEEYIADRTIRYFDPMASYQRVVSAKISLDRIRAADCRVLFDPMYGAGMEVLPAFVACDAIHNQPNPGFGEIGHPEPIAECLQPAAERMKAGSYDICIATDGDADRLGLLDAAGNFVDSHRIFMLLLKYLYEDKRRRGIVVKTVSLTSMVERYCQRHGIELVETPVGFKHTAKLMLERRVLIGGEESGGLGTILHIPERDGIFNALLVLDMMVARGKTLAELVAALDDEFGPHRYRRRDVHVTEQQKQRILRACARMPKAIARYRVERVVTIDGYKFFFSDGSWLLIRASGTEPLVRFYAESSSQERADELVEAGIALALG
ncbi:MAG: phosphoglucomutase/phosphomannomutase family protein [Chlorobi bacterium]|jgi:phosphomannomutase|nr:phosphoglucomutase/phosphomannomutase family protein [Chlorobiota bacterium]